jgi:hypothetical protein
MRNPVDDDWYCSLFQARRNREMAAEATPDYAIIGEDGFRHIKRLAPGVWLMLILRNPVERAWSQLLHYHRFTNIDPCLVTSEDWIARVDTPRYTAAGNYTCILDNLKVFAKEQVRVDFYEDIHADRNAALESICSFMGLSYHPRFFKDVRRRYNRSQPVDIPKPVRVHLRQKYAGLVRDIENRVGRVPAAWSTEFKEASSVAHRPTWL